LQAVAGMSEGCLCTAWDFIVSQACFFIGWDGNDYELNVIVKSSCLQADIIGPWGSIPLTSPPTTFGARTSAFKKYSKSTSNLRHHKPKYNIMATTAQIQLPLPVLPSGWSGEKDFKAVSSLSGPVHRSIEPVGAHFLAYARRKRFKRTFSEDERIQAAENVKKVEDVDDGDISEPEDPLMLQRDAKQWKVGYLNQTDLKIAQC
jgi:hypothetical protein